MTTTISGGLRVALRAPLLPDLLLALCVCWIAASVYLSHYGVGNALSSDNVMPYVMFDDLFRRDVGLRGFLWPESPFYFPDTLLAWTIGTIHRPNKTASHHPVASGLIFINGFV